MFRLRKCSFHRDRQLENPPLSEYFDAFRLRRCSLHRGVPNIYEGFTVYPFPAPSTEFRKGNTLLIWLHISNLIVIGSFQYFGMVKMTDRLLRYRKPQHSFPFKVFSLKSNQTHRHPVFTTFNKRDEIKQRRSRQSSDRQCYVTKNYAEQHETSYSLHKYKL